MAKILKGPKLQYLGLRRTIGEFLFEMGEKHGDKIAQIDAETDIQETFSSIKLKSIRLAIELQKMGITSKDIILLCSSNTLDSVLPVLATSYLAAKVASLDPTLSVKNVNYLINLVNPTLIFVEDTSLNLIEGSFKGLENRPTIVVIGQTTKYLKFDELLKPSEEEKNFTPTIVDINETAFIFFSSGTTGLQKGICLSHMNLFHTMNELTQSGRKCSIHLPITTLYWISAVGLLLTAYSIGGRRILLRQLSIENLYRCFEKYKVSLLLTSLKSAFMLANYPDALKYDTSHFRNLIVGGGRAGEKLLQDLTRALPHTTIDCPYALTEAGVVTSDRPSYERKLGSNGRVCPGVSIKVVNPETDEILSANQRGEIRVKSAGVMVGYHKMESAQEFDNEGFLKTGDVGYYDDNGNFYIVERLKDMFKYQGWHIIPTHLETIILEHPAVLETVVFGVPGTQEDGEYPTALVLLKDEYKKMRAEEILEFVTTRVLDRERLRGGLHIVESILKTVTGKPRRRMIKEEFLKNLTK